MMNYELFKRVIAERIKDYMPLEYQTHAVCLGTVRKVNRSFDCLNLRPADEETIRMSPNIILQDLYEEFQKHQDMERVLKETAMRVEYAMHHLFPELQELNFSALLDRVIFTLMNTEMNREILEGVPSREFMDLSVVYRFFLENNGMTGTILISNDMMRELDLTEEKLYVMARENTMKLMPVLMIPFERFEKIVSARQFKRNPQVLVEAEKESSRDDLGAYILTNHMGMNGAVGMLYESRLFQLAEKIGSNFFILPSTLHQVMAISEESADWDAMKEMPSIPGEERLIRPEEMLSKKIYYYDRFTRKLRFSTEVLSEGPMI